MPKLILPKTVVFLAILMTLAACTQATPTPSPAETTAPTSTTTATAPPANITVPTDIPAPTTTPTERPTAAPTATPAKLPTAATHGTLAPLDIQDPQRMTAQLSDSDLDCIGGDPASLTRTLAGPGTAPKSEQARMLECLEDETLARLFLSGFVPTPEPLSLEASACVRTVFRVIDPRSVMTAGLEGTPQAAMAGSMAAFSVTMACLTDEEWAKVGPEMGIGPDERAGMQCLMEALGGPGEMASAMTTAQQGDLTDFAAAGAECGLDMGTPPGQTPTGPSQAPTPAPLPTHINQAPSKALDIPALTDDQVTKMNESISGDPLLTVILQQGYTINDYGPWVAGDRTFIGAIAEIFLTTPTDYRGSLPMVGFEPAEDGSKKYRSKTFDITASGIKSLFILVDIAEEEVVGIEIGESDTLTLSTEGE